MLNVGLLGAGRIGNVHARAISAHPASKLVAVVRQASARESDRSTGFSPEVAATGRLVMIGFYRRFDPNFVALKSAADQDEIVGTPLFETEKAMVK